MEMTSLSALVLASMMTVQPPILADAQMDQPKAIAAQDAPMIDASAINAFVAEAAARYRGD